MNYKIIGFDESGKSSDPYIIFTQVEFDEKSEFDIFIDILLKTEDFFLQKDIKKTWSKKKKIMLAHTLLENKLITVKFYKLNSEEQNKILNDVFKYQARFLFGERKSLIKSYETDKIKQKHISHLIGQLHHYRNYSFLPDFCLKSYSFLYILNKLSNEYRICNFLKNPDNIIKVQIDGGGIFAFWWFDLINTHINKDILQKQLFINGIPHGDQYYLSMNLADLLSHTLHIDNSLFFKFSIDNIKYNFNEINFSEELFYEKIWNFLKNPIFKNRLLLIGDSKLFNLIPYVLHRKQRNIIYEPFLIKDKIEDFFKYFKIGSPEKNLAIYSEYPNQFEKDNIDYCKSKNIETKSITEYKDDFLDFFKEIEDATIYYSKDSVTKIENLLNNKRVLL